MRGARAKVKIKARTESRWARRASATPPRGRPLALRGGWETRSGRGGGRGGDGTQRAPPPRGARAPPLARRAAPRATGRLCATGRAGPERRARRLTRRGSKYKGRGGRTRPSPQPSAARRLRRKAAPGGGSAPPAPAPRLGWAPAPGAACGPPPRVLGPAPVLPLCGCCGRRAPSPRPGEGPQEPEALGSAGRRAPSSAGVFPLPKDAPPSGYLFLRRCPGSGSRCARASRALGPSPGRAAVPGRAPRSCWTCGPHARGWGPGLAPRGSPPSARPHRPSRVPGCPVRCPRAAGLPAAPLAYAHPGAPPAAEGLRAPPRTLPAPPLWGPRKWAADGAGRQSLWGACARPRRGAAGGPYPRRR